MEHRGLIAQMLIAFAVAGFSLSLARFHCHKDDDDDDVVEAVLQWPGITLRETWSTFLNELTDFELIYALGMVGMYVTWRFRFVEFEELGHLPHRQLSLINMLTVIPTGSSRHKLSYFAVFVITISNSLPNTSNHMYASQLVDYSVLSSLNSN